MTAAAPALEAVTIFSAGSEGRKLGEDPQLGSERALFRERGQRLGGKTSPWDKTSLGRYENATLKLRMTRRQSVVGRHHHSFQLGYQHTSL